MNEDQKRWNYQYSSNMGAKELLRLGCAIMIWLLLGVGISVAFDLAGYSWGLIFFTGFFIAMFIFAFTAHSWRTRYLVLRKIIGNENLPREPYPRSTVKIYREPRPWWSYFAGLWFTLMTLIVFYFAIKYLLK